MTFKERWQCRDKVEALRRDAAIAEGVAAERKRILGLLEKFTVGSSLVLPVLLKRAIEHPEPDAGETKSP